MKKHKYIKPKFVVSRIKVRLYTKRRIPEVGGPVYLAAPTSYL